MLSLRTCHAGLLSFVIVFVIVIVMATPYAAASEPMQSLDIIQKRVEEFLLAKHANNPVPPKVQVSQLDPRLRLARCNSDLEPFLPNGARAIGNTTVGIRCSRPHPWTIYLRASVRVLGDVLVAARFLPIGTLLTKADLKTERRDLFALQGNFTTAHADIVGKQLRRPLRIGSVIPPQALIAPPLIRRGEKVTIWARGDGMEVSSSGIALSDAFLGDHLRVRNESSQKVIEGTVTAAQRIEIEL